MPAPQQPSSSLTSAAGSGSVQALVRCSSGCTREVFLVGRWAIKVPQFRYDWRHFLQGLLANMQERYWWKNFPKPELCPVLWGLPGGWCIVMRRATPMTREQFDEIDLVAWCERGDWKVPAEPKMDSFGWIDGRLVAVDYGN